MKSDDPFRAQFTVEKLGAIEHAELTIRPLTLFFGPNGTNKTWAAYALYGLLRRYHNTWFDTAQLDQVTVQEFGRRIRQLQSDVRAGTATSGSTTMSVARPSGPLTLDGEQLSELMALTQKELWFAQAGLAVETLPHGVNEALIEVHVEQARRAGPSIEFDRRSGYRAEATLGPSGGGELLSTIMGDFMELAFNVVALPAERKALLTLHRQLAALSALAGQEKPRASGRLADLSRSMVDGQLRAAAHALGRTMPQPAVDFVSFINQLALSFEQRWRPPLEPLAKRLNEMIGGRLVFTPGVVEGGPGALRFLSSTANLPIQSSHSLVRSLGGLDLFLQFRAQRGDFVFIDEPEMNAHPETQVAIAEFIALMVNAGLRVVATTHSPYIIDHLHNLIEADRLAPDAQARFADHFKLKTADAFISANKVAAYHFGRDGTITDAFDRSERVIDWSILGDDSDDIANLYSELLGAQLDE